MSLLSYLFVSLYICVGPCSTLLIETVYSNGGGRALTFAWYIKYRAGLDSNTSADMSALNASLANKSSDLITIGKEFIVRNVLYEIVVRVQNFLGSSNEATFSVMRRQKEVPEITFNSAGGKIKLSHKLRLLG